MNNLEDFLFILGYENPHPDRFVLRVGFRPIGDAEDLLMALAARFAELPPIAQGRLQQLRTQHPNFDWTVSVVLESHEYFEIIRNNRIVNVNEFGVNRRFQSMEDLRESLIEGLIDAFDRLAQSNENIDVSLFELQIRFDGVPRAANGKVKKHILKAIASDAHTKGLYKYRSEKECGYRAIIYALAAREELRTHWSGGLDWFVKLFPQNITVLGDLRSENRFRKLTKELRNQIGAEEEEWTMHPGGTSNMFILTQPKLQLLIFNEVTRQLMIKKRGNDFRIDNAKESTIVMSYTLGHLHLVKSVYEYFGKLQGRTSYYCFVCLEFKPPVHQCGEFKGRQCERCAMKFINEDQYSAHISKKDTDTCLKCDRKFYSEACLTAHRCLSQHVEVCDTCCKKKYRSMVHVCGMYICSNCRKLVPGTHRCSIQVLELPEVEAPEGAGSNYWAFDLESMFHTQEDGSDVHEVNLVVLKRCFSNEEYTFQTMEEFINWITGYNQKMTLFAHNLKGYDGRMVFDYLFNHHQPPQEMVWRGTKIMSMSYGKITFRDTLLHLPASLEQLPKMFGLDPREFKKGFFPYKFNTPENQQYKGVIPAKHYFCPQGMSTKKLGEFNEWHGQQVGEYDFHRELVEYCQSDTRILGKAIEAYMVKQMQLHPLNPLSKMTIASYAMTMYRTFYMPVDSLVRLSATEHDEISLSMHGGRTDTRRMLREWTEEEVAAGVYGQYQDVQSLYPTVQFYDPLPVGKPIRRGFPADNQPTPRELDDLFGFICCDIEPARYLHHPVLVHLDTKTGRLLADLLPKKSIMLATPELHLALANGYKVTRVYYWYEFQFSFDLFKEYFRKFIKCKLEASGTPAWVDSEEKWREFSDYHQEELEINLRPEDMVANAAQKTGAKLLCNSLWGKFGEKSKNYIWRSFATGGNDDQVMGLENRWINGDIDIVYRKYSKDNEAVGMLYLDKRTIPSANIYERKKRGHKNIALASMITSYARCRLWKELNKLGDRVLYHDTDSIIYEHRPDQYNIPMGKYLGEWEDETDGLPIVKFVSTGPKCYSYTVRKPDGSYKKDTKIKGVTLHHDNASLINFDSMKSLVLDENDRIETKALSFKYNRREGSMSTMEVMKLFKKTYQKGFIHPGDLKVYPFGWHRFLDPTTMNPVNRDLSRVAIVESQ